MDPEDIDMEKQMLRTFIIHYSKISSDSVNTTAVHVCSQVNLTKLIRSINAYTIVLQSRILSDVAY